MYDLLETMGSRENDILSENGSTTMMFKVVSISVDLNLSDPRM